MEKRKKVILVLVSFIIFGILIIIIFLKVAKQDQTLRTVSPPLIPKQSQINLPISTSLEEKDFDIPSKAPLLEIKTASIDKNDALALASNLDFDGEPLSTNDPREGTKYIWSDDTFYLIVTPKISQIRYGLNTFVSIVENKNLNDNQLTEIALNFLDKSSLISRGEVKLTSITFLKEIPQSEGFVNATSKEEAEIFQLNFTYKVSDYEILTRNPREPLIFIQIQPDGTVFKAQLNILGEIAKTEEEYGLIDFQELINSVNNAVLVDIIGGYINIPDLAERDLKSIKVNKVNLAYLMDTPTATILKPIFLLKGIIEISGYEEPVEALLYLSATKTR